MNKKESHRKYVDALLSLSDKSGYEMSGFVMRIFKEIFKRSKDPESFVRNIRIAKPKLQRAMRKKAMKAANRSFNLGKQFAAEKKK